MAATAAAAVRFCRAGRPAASLRLSWASVARRHYGAQSISTPGAEIGPKTWIGPEDLETQYVQARSEQADTLRRYQTGDVGIDSEAEAAASEAAWRRTLAGVALAAAAGGGLGACAWYGTNRPPMADAASQAAFLEEKSRLEGVIACSSGLLYRVLRQGDGKHHPAASAPCFCRYRGTLTDGSEFDNSQKICAGGVATFRPNVLIKGWAEALQLMVEGDIWEIFVPPELGYGDQGQGDRVPGGAVLVFRVELVKILGDRVRRSGPPPQGDP